jgi:hypothetical protein
MHDLSIALLKSNMFFLSLADPPSYKVALSGAVIMAYSYDDISLFVSQFNIPVSLSYLFQRIASVYDRFNFSRF